MSNRVSSTAKPIDNKWAEQLLGLRLKVPSHWWQGHSGTNLHDGKLTSFDEEVAKWVFTLDDIDDDEPCLMRYNAVVKYCDTNASTFANYTLPAKPIKQPEQEAVIAGKKYIQTLAKD